MCARESWLISYLSILLPIACVSVLFSLPVAFQFVVPVQFIWCWLSLASDRLKPRETIQSHSQTLNSIINFGKQRYQWLTEGNAQSTFTRVWHTNQNCTDQLCDALQQLGWCAKSAKHHFGMLWFRTQVFLNHILNTEVYTPSYRGHYFAEWKIHWFQTSQWTVLIKSWLV